MDCTGTSSEACRWHSSAHRWLCTPSNLESRSAVALKESSPPQALHSLVLVFFYHLLFCGGTENSVQGGLAIPLTVRHSVRITDSEVDALLEVFSFLLSFMDSMHISCWPAAFLIASVSSWGVDCGGDFLQGSWRD